MRVRIKALSLSEAGLWYYNKTGNVYEVTEVTNSQFKIFDPVTDEYKFVDKMHVDDADGINPITLKPLIVSPLPAVASLPTAVVGRKDDQDKIQWSLFPLSVLPCIIKVMMYGAKKYERDNWKLVEPIRYEDAMWRHWNSFKEGELLDPESKLPHLWHFACNVIFYLWLKEKGTES